MEQEENKNYKKGRQKVKNIKVLNIRSVLLVLTLTFSLCYLAVNYFKSYQYSSRIEFELMEIKKKHLEQTREYNSLKTKLNTETSESEDKTKHLVPEDLIVTLNKKINNLMGENGFLKNHNKELSEDNISLQNSLKLAALAGIKPRNYEHPPEVTSRSGIQRERYIGKFKGTAYTPSKKECGNNKGMTASGKPIIPGTTIAVDTRYWPIGTIFYIKGIGYVEAMDTGNKVKGKNRFDFAVFDRKFAYALGTKYWEVYLVKRGTGKVDTAFFANR